MVSWILPKNERWGNFMYWKLPQRSFFGRIQNNIFFFRDFLTFSKINLEHFLDIKSGPNFIYLAISTFFYFNFPGSEKKEKMNWCGLTNYGVMGSKWNHESCLPQSFPEFFLKSSWKRKQTSYWSKTVIFSQFATWKRNQYIFAKYLVWSYDLVLLQARKSEKGQIINFILRKYLNLLCFSLNKEHSDIYPRKPVKS